MGLLGASERALSLGGHLTVQGEPGHGTTLELWLPAPVPVRGTAETPATRDEAEREAV